MESEFQVFDRGFEGVLDIAIELDLVISGVEVGNGTVVACKDLEVSGILYG